MEALSHYQRWQPPCYGAIIVSTRFSRTFFVLATQCFSPKSLPLLKSFVRAGHLLRRLIKRCQSFSVCGAALPTPARHASSASPKPFQTSRRRHRERFGAIIVSTHVSLQATKPTKPCIRGGQSSPLLVSQLSIRG